MLLIDPTVMAVLAFFIPNIHRRVKKSTKTVRGPAQRKERAQRFSVVSFRGSVQSLYQ